MDHPKEGKVAVAEMIEVVETRAVVEMTGAVVMMVQNGQMVLRIAMGCLLPTSHHAQH